MDDKCCCYCGDDGGDNNNAAREKNSYRHDYDEELEDLQYWKRMLIESREVHRQLPLLRKKKNNNEEEEQNYEDRDEEKRQRYHWEEVLRRQIGQIGTYLERHYISGCCCSLPNNDDRSGTCSTGTHRSSSIHFHRCLRLVLRVARSVLTSCLQLSLSVSSSSSSSRVDDDKSSALLQLQEVAFAQWHQSLIHIILLFSRQDVVSLEEDCPQKTEKNGVELHRQQIQELAAQVLCNTVTENPDNAHHLLLFLAVATGANNNNNDDDEIAEKDEVGADQQQKKKTPSLSWVDLLLSCRQNRPALAAVVACLYNATAAAAAATSAAAITHHRDDNEDDDRVSLPLLLFPSPLLIETLLRHVIAAAKKSPETTAAASRRSNNNNDRYHHHSPTLSDPLPLDDDDDENRHGDEDEATEWISLYLFLWGWRWGHLESMYRAIGAGGGTGTRTRVLPEHVVLLHVVWHQLLVSTSTTKMEDETSTPNTTATTTNNKDDDKTAMMENTTDDITNNEPSKFLACLYLELLAAVIHGMAPHDGDISDDDQALRASAMDVTLDILAQEAIVVSTTTTTTTTKDSSSPPPPAPSALWKESMGRLLLPSLLRELGNMLDGWVHKTSALSNVRDQTKSLTQLQKRHVTCLVRLVGNLCFACTSNQDLLRTTLVPFLSTTQAPEEQNDASQTKQQQQPPEPRNGLHVLLSITSMSYACFTLREWAVVAIRYAILDHAENQKIVQRLQAEQTVPNTVLQEMGIEIQLDNQNGNVTVATTNATNEQPNGQR